MAYASPHYPFATQLPSHFNPYGSQYPHACNGHHCGPRHESPPTPPLETPDTDQSIRIALLEKELQQCKVGKAEAEIAVQYLASLSAKSVRHGGTEEEQISKLQQQLAQIEKEKQSLAAKLENALEIITTMLTFRSKSLANHATSTIKSSKPSNLPIKAGDLIDLLGAAGDSDDTLVSAGDTILPGYSSNDTSDDENDEKQAATPKRVQSHDFPGSPYKYHFTTSEDDDDIQTAKTLKSALEIVRTSAGIKQGSTSPDQRSETSAEPNSEGSSHEYAASSDEQASSSASFATANTELVLGNDDFDNSHATSQTIDSHVLAVRNWNTLETAFPPSHGQSQAQTKRAQQAASPENNDIDSSWVRPSRGSAMIKPLWKVSTIFPSEKLRNETIKIHKHEVGSSGLKFPDLFKYGLRFNPSASIPNVYRTVLFKGLSTDTTLAQLLEHVRGGTVIDAKLLDTEKITGNNTALVVFFCENEALACEDYSKTHPIVVNNQAILVNALPTPTYPMSLNLRTAVEDYRHTRCLEIYNYPRHVPLAALRADLRICPQMEGDRIVHVDMRKDGVLEIHFSAINYAGQAFAMFTSFRLYRGCKAYFMEDPCSQPVESLSDCKEAIGTVQDGLPKTINDSFDGSIVVNAEEVDGQTSLDCDN